MPATLHEKVIQMHSKLFQFATARLCLGMAVSLFCFQCPSSAFAAQKEPADFVWVESEKPTAANIDMKPSPWGGKVMSGDNWLQVNIDDKDVEKKTPAGGILLSYKFNAPTTGTYQVWNRLGFENVRSAFDWRLDDAAWKAVSPDEITTDLTEIGFWASIAWLKMGQTSLNAGSHTLQIRLPITYDVQKKPQRIFYSSDALCLFKGDFHPNGPYRPNDMSWQTPAIKSAANKTFSMPATTPSAQNALSLRGEWQIARWDEMLVKDRTAPIKSLPNPEDLHWESISIPGDKNKQRPELTFAHRYFLRTRVDIPAGSKDHSYYLHFPSLNMIASVFVNGQYCGSDDTPFALWDCDISKAVKSGNNEIWVGIKDTYYAIDTNDGKNLRTSFMMPTEFFTDNQGSSMTLDFPVWNHRENGILQEPTLVSAGKVYTSDVFALPSVKNKSLGLEITLKNPTANPIDVTVANSVAPLKSGDTEKTFETKQVQVPAGKEVVIRLNETFAKPKLWWPDDPQQYLVTTKLSVGGKQLDSRTTKFGFREWDWHGATFTLNGIPWHGRADLADFGVENPEAAVATWHRHGQNMQRLWNENGQGGMNLEQTLDFYDSHGIPVRRTGIFDGEKAAYRLTEQVKVNGKETTVARRALYDNWHRQLRAWARGQRNHPSIFIWSMENEITFINSSVFGLNPITDLEMRKAGQILAQLDPTRPQMTDGGNALLDESLPVYGGHYMEAPLSSLPDAAYDIKGLTDRQKWPITHQKPILMGEAYFASGFELSSLATVGGESAFVGKAESHPALGLIGKIYSEGYRWNGISFHFWLGGESDAYYNSWQPVAVLCRQWDWTFGSGQKVVRTMGIFNDTRFDDPIMLTCTLKIGGKTAATETSVHKIAAGMNHKFDVTLTMPQVSTRQEGEWTLALSVKGKQVFQDTKQISVLGTGRPTALFHKSKTQISGTKSTVGGAHSSAGSKPGRLRLASQVEGSLVVYDPNKSVTPLLTADRITFTPISSLSSLPANAKTLLIGKDAVDAVSSTSGILAAYAAAGRSVIVLEQKFPLQFQALPGAMRLDKNEGRIGFVEDLDHPIMMGLAQKDFFTWSGDGVLYRNAYNKPTSGGKSLLQCDDQLKDSALIEMPSGKGILLLSQLVIGEKAATSPVAHRLLLNMIDYGQTYKQVFRSVALVSDNPRLTKAVDAIGVAYGKDSDVLSAIAKPGSIAVVSATSANLKTLAQNEAKVKTFTEGGGWLLLNNLTPEGLGDYNKLVGVAHLIRPFGREKVTFPAVRNPLTAGLATSNIVIGSGKQIFDYNAGQYPATDAFSYVVDYDDVAPFGKSTFFAYDNIVNNFVSADGWPLIIDFPAPTEGKPFPIPITFPRQETITEFTYVGNVMYNPTTKVNLVFDGKNRVELPTRPDDQPQTFAIPSLIAAKEITLEIAEWKSLPDKRQNGQDLIGIDNIYLKAKRTPEFYKKVKPLLNIGAMVAYPQGSGGIVLCNVNFLDNEAVPENVIKKQTILATLLRNMKAPFAGSGNAISSANLVYQPIDISKQANQYRGEQGWFGDKNFTFAAFPGGRQTFAGVDYSIYTFATSPVPTAVMLAGEGVPNGLADSIRGIPVGRKADALFFLQAARIDQRRNEQEVRDNSKFETADYVINYADGQQVKVPIYSEIDIEDYKQKSPAPLPGAQIAWLRPYEGTPYTAVAYQMRWNNPRPNVEIKSIDIVYGQQRRGVIALLAVSAGVKSGVGK